MELPSDDEEEEAEQARRERETCMAKYIPVRVWNIIFHGSSSLQLHWRKTAQKEETTAKQEGVHGNKTKRNLQGSNRFVRHHQTDVFGVRTCVGMSWYFCQTIGHPLVVLRCPQKTLDRSRMEPQSQASALWVGPDRYFEWMYNTL